MGDAKPIRPWLFVPVLYFMQAMPVTIVQEVSAVFFKDLGIANASITQWTSLLSLPWSLQFLLGPLVDLTGKKRNWILYGQALILVGLILAALTLQMPHPFEFSLVLLGATAVVSALCNIATDGFYILALPKDDQARFVGVQTTFYRLGRLFCSGLIVWVVGLILRSGTMTGDPKVVWSSVLIAGSLVYGLGFLIARSVTPPLTSDLRHQDSELARNVLRTLAIIVLGLCLYFAANALVRLGAHGLWAAFGGDPAGKWKGWMLPAHDTVLGFDLGLGPLLVECLQLGVSVMLGSSAFAYVRRSLKGTQMGEAFNSFVRQSGFWAIFGFILFYRFGEAMVSRMSPLFLKDAVGAGGLAVPNDRLGLIKGVAGVIGIVLGGICGGVFVSKLGLRRAFWPMAILMHLPNLLYLWASIARPGADSPLLFGVDFVDQFGYGFGFAGYSLYLMWIAQRGRFQTAHYAIGTGMGALCIAMAGVLSGVIQSNFGYPWFFASVIILTLPGMAMLAFIPLDEA